MVTTRFLHTRGGRTFCFNQTRSKPPSKARKFLSVSMVVGAMIGFQVCDLAWSAAVPPQTQAKTRKTVAAGFGFQDSQQSSITVKTYDAESGEVLSAETYELDIKDDGPPSSHPVARIFAGGVGSGADGLSEFALRVYDAADGRFLWEGRLNLTMGDNPNFSAVQVAAHTEFRAVVTKVSSPAQAYGQPYFVLRALNPETGQLVWADEFSADSSHVRPERISSRVLGTKGLSPRDIDFRIKMPDAIGRRLLWEDRVIPNDEEVPAESDPSDAAAGMLPAWPQREGRHQDDI